MIARQYLSVALVALAVVVLQTTLLRTVSQRMELDLIFVMVVLIGLFKDPVHGSIMTFCLGWIEDLISPGITGLYMTARMSVFLVAQALQGRLSQDVFTYQIAIGFGLGVLDRFIVFVLYGLFSSPHDMSFRTVVLMLVGSALNALAVPVFYFIFTKIPDFVEMPRGPRVKE